MKKYLLLFFCLFFLTCSKENEQTSNYYCPEVYFSKKHRIYISSEDNSINLNNISYRVEINNYNFVKGCKLKDKNLEAKLSILFIVKPDKAINTNILIPYYIALIDENKKIIDIQYYKFEGELNKDNDQLNFIETEVISKNNLIIPNYFNQNKENKNKLLVGFMLNKQKLELLN